VGRLIPIQLDFVRLVLCGTFLRLHGEIVESYFLYKLIIVESFEIVRLDFRNPELIRRHEGIGIFLFKLYLVL